MVLDPMHQRAIDIEVNKQVAERLKGFGGHVNKFVTDIKANCDELMAALGKVCEVAVEEEHLPTLPHLNGASNALRSAEIARLFKVLESQIGITRPDFAVMLAVSTKMATTYFAGKRPEQEVCSRLMQIAEMSKQGDVEKLSRMHDMSAKAKKTRELIAESEDLTSDQINQFFDQGVGVFKMSAERFGALFNVTTEVFKRWLLDETMPQGITLFKLMRYRDASQAQKGEWCRAGIRAFKADERCSDKLFDVKAGKKAS